MSPPKQAELFTSTGLAFASGACAGYYAKHAGATGIMIAVAFGLTVAIVGIFYSRWLKKRSVVLEISEPKQPAGQPPSEYLRITIKNLSDHPITVVDAWVQLDSGDRIPILGNVIGVFPRLLHEHGGMWDWKFMKNRLPNGVNCDKRVRARLMDGATLKSRRGDPPPYGESVWFT